MKMLIEMPTLVCDKRRVVLPPTSPTPRTLHVKYINNVNPLVSGNKIPRYLSFVVIIMLTRDQRSQKRSKATKFINEENFFGFTRS